MGHLSCNEYYDNIRLNRILRHERHRIAHHHNLTPEQLLRRAAYYQAWPDRYATFLRFTDAQKTERYRSIMRAASRSQRARHEYDVSNRQVERPVRYQHAWQLEALERPTGVLPAEVIDTEPSTQSLNNVDDTETKKVENPEQEQATGDAKPSTQANTEVKKESNIFDLL